MIIQKKIFKVYKLIIIKKDKIINKLENFKSDIYKKV